MLAAALLVLLLEVTFEQRGMLSGTLLGEFIMVHVERFHYAMVGTSLVLAAISTANGLLGSIVERRREIGVLRAVGWHTRAVARLFVVQGTLLSLAGGAVGALLGSLAFAFLYRSISPGLALAFLTGVSVPGAVGALAALYPAQVAARIPPAEAVRYE
jgi:putative ABC transport system permease protein